MYREYRITLPGGFPLPIALAIEKITAYDSTPQNLFSQEEMLSSFSLRYLSEQMTAGKILDADTTVSQGDGVWLLNGEYVCREMIGREKQEQIGVNHGKDNGTDGQRGTH